MHFRLKAYHFCILSLIIPMADMQAFSKTFLGNNQEIVMIFVFNVNNVKSTGIVMIST